MVCHLARRLEIEQCLIGRHNALGLVLWHVAVFKVELQERINISITMLYFISRVFTQFYRLTATPIDGNGQKLCTEMTHGD